MPPYATGPEPCGTYPAYRRHRYNGESPCLPCRKANAARSVVFRAKVKAKRAAPEPTGWQPGFAVDVMALLDVCEAIEPEWDREAAPWIPHPPFLGAEF
jgi:hypothetical protein